MKKLILLSLTLFLGFACLMPSFAEVEDKTIVYYFYSKPRCISCKKIETYTQNAVTELNNKNIVYKPVNVDLPENKHYIKDYGLYTKAVILSEIKDSKEVKSKNLTEIWMKFNNEKTFKIYITNEINKF